jgi:cyclophilin family peptidyl-prolyl cis-trans isomerase/HEAT repeat protein
VLTSFALSLILAAPPAPPPPLSRIEKMGRILALEDRRGKGGPELEGYLRDADRSVRRRAALAAGRIADPATVTPLVALLGGDAEPEVRQMAAFALGLIGQAPAASGLVAALKDQDAVVRARSAEALGRLGDAARARDVAAMVLAAVPREAPLVTVRGDDPGSAADPWLELRLGLLALARLKDAAAAESVLLRNGHPRFDWWAAAYTAMRIASPGLRPALLAAAASSDALSRVYGARGLGALKDTGALDVLARLCLDRDEEVAVSAVRAIGTIGDARGVAAVAAVLNAASSTLKQEALKALAALPPDPGTRSRILPYVGHEQPALRAAALPALARIDGEEFALVLSGLDPDPVWFVRAALAGALAEAGDETSVGLLLGLLKDEDARVLPAVLEAVRKARGRDAVDTLRRHLSHPDLAVRAAAAEGLAALKAPGLGEALAACYRLSLADADLDARLAVIAALKEQKDEVSRALLREAARQDGSRAVRERAGSALRELGESPPEAGFEELARAALDYREAMAPYEPPADRPLYSPRAILHTSRGRIEFHLDVVETPLTTESFLRLARRGFFDGLSFHRVVPGFVIQGGCPRGDGNGGPGYTLRCEISERPYGRGTVGMALSGKDTGGSQFFITHAPAPHLDGGYTAFGRVASGMDVVDRIQPGDVIERVEIWDGTR